MWWVGRYSINDSGAENKDDLPPTIQEQDIELAQRTPHHYDGNTELQGDNDEVRRLKTYFMHICTSWSLLIVYYYYE